MYVLGLFVVTFIEFTTTCFEHMEWWQALVDFQWVCNDASKFKVKCLQLS